VARIFLPGSGESSGKKTLSQSARVFCWADQDSVARDLTQRKLKGETISLRDQDAVIDERKKERKKEGFELFDDWFLRQCDAAEGSDPDEATMRVDLVLENLLNLSEVELHVEPGASPTPRAHECLRQIEDDDEDTPDEDDADDGTGSFLDYFLRRCQSHLAPDRLHCVDPRNLGNPEDECENDLLQALLPAEPLPQSLEVMDQSALAQAVPQEAEADASKKRTLEDEDTSVEHPSKKRRAEGGKIAFRLGKSGVKPNPLPSWEGFFGCTAGVLLYSPHVKVDFVPLMAQCLSHSSAEVGL
jgi:hypothetical protein